MSMDVATAEARLLRLHLVAVMMLVMRERGELLRKAGQALVDRVHACSTTDGCNDGKGEEVLHGARGRWNCVSNLAMSSTP